MSRTRPAPAVSRGRPTRSSVPRVVELIPIVVLGASFGIMAAIRPNAVRDLVSGARAILVTLGIVVGWVVLSRVVLPRLVRNGWLRVGVLSALAVALVLVLILPTVVDKTVVEALPGSRGEQPPATADAGASTPDTTAAPVAPVAIASGALAGIDHHATGAAVLYERPGGSFVVGLENIDIEPGPDYKVYVVPGGGRQSPGDDGVLLDDLRGNQGTQYYTVPGGIDVSSGPWTVLVWCRLFAVPVANATPA